MAVVLVALAERAAAQLAAHGAVPLPADPRGRRLRVHVVADRPVEQGDLLTFGRLVGEPPPKRKVHLRRSTCHLISGRGGVGVLGEAVLAEAAGAVLVAARQQSGRVCTN